MMVLKVIHKAEVICIVEASMALVVRPLKWMAETKIMVERTFELFNIYSNINANILTLQNADIYNERKKYRNKNMNKEKSFI